MTMGDTTQQPETGMAIKLISTRAAAAKHGVKILIHGQSGAGKTRLCATTGGNPLIISAEAGLLSLREFDLPAVTVSTLADVGEVYDWLASSEEAKNYDWICLDSISEIAEVVLSEEKAQTKDPRKAYGEMQDRMAGLLRMFRDLPRHVYMSCKQARLEDQDTGATKYGPMMPGQKLAQSLPYLFDEVFSLHTHEADDGTVERALQTRLDSHHVAKDRSGALDAFEPADLSHIAAKILNPQE